ncbi:MAG: hypothetical protein HZY74_05915 [Brevundimonas sp.]|nr:MAG: hypothetical protein HZY74_05915 [Brevundimonas sp.]
MRRGQHDIIVRNLDHDRLGRRLLVLHGLHQSAFGREVVCHREHVGDRPEPRRKAGRDSRRVPLDPLTAARSIGLKARPHRARNPTVVVIDSPHGDVPLVVQHRFGEGVGLPVEAPVSHSQIQVLALDV